MAIRKVRLVTFAGDVQGNAAVDKLTGLGYAVDPIATDAWLEGALSRPADLDVMLLDHRDLPRERILARLVRPVYQPTLGVVRHEAVEGLREILSQCGDFAGWPCQGEELVYRIERLCIDALRPDESVPACLADEFLDLNLVGRSQPFLAVLSLIRKVSQCGGAPVLLRGDTGTGKEMVARAIHYRSSRRDGPFVPVNCGAIPESLTENELFGHERGAFTDARGTQAGLVGQADGGTLFLDEVDALSAKAQVALLRFLQDNEYRPLGSRKVHKTDVRVVAATNADLAGLVRDRSFREDLLFRLNVLTIKLPTLRERCEDVALLAQHFIQQSSAKYDRPPKSLHPETLVWMRRYDWPGNVRELENLIEREFLMGEGATLRLSPPSEMRMERRQRAGDRRKLAGFDGAFNRIKAHVMEDFELRYLRWVLAETHGNVTLAATRAGKERRALGKLLKKHGINPRDFAPER
jgi:DNA-binding NtrC family response regulator